jgi:elongation factor G
VAPRARPILLEPIVAVEIFTPNEMMGDVLGDLSPRRGHIVSTDTLGRLTRVTALVPQAELYKYSTVLHSITHGRGTHKEKSHGYAEAPAEVAAKVASENKDRFRHEEDG